MQICDILNETLGIAKDPTDTNGYHFFELRKVIHQRKIFKLKKNFFN